MIRYAAAALASALVLAGTVAWVQTGRVEALRARLAESETARAAARATFEAAAAEQRRAIAVLERARADDQRHLDALARENARVTEERNDVTARFDDYRNRIAKAALARPSLVGRAATRAVRRLFDAFRAASAPDGRAPDGGARSIPPAAAGADRGPR